MSPKLLKILSLQKKIINDKISKSENGLPHLVHFSFQHKCLNLLTLLVILNFAFPPLKKKRKEKKTKKDKTKERKNYTSEL